MKVVDPHGVAVVGRGQDRLGHAGVGLLIGLPVPAREKRVFIFVVEERPQNVVAKTVVVAVVQFAVDNDGLERELLVLAFGELAQPLIDRIVAAASEIRTLAETRDYLLPRLMSGEVRVGGAVQEIAA